MDPRPYQAEAVQKITDYATENIRGRLLVVCPPGGGKTLIGAIAMRLLASDQGLRGLAWAHRRELVGQMCDHLVECGIPSKMIGVVMAGDKRYNPTAPIQVGSVDTIRHRNKPLADFVVSDEAHRDASDGRRKLRALYPDAFHLGLTATPVRLDGRGLRAEYDEMFVAAQPSELIAEGWLAAPMIYTVPPELLPDLKGVKKTGGDFAVGELEARTNKRALVGNIVEHWQRLAEGRRTIVYPVGIKHSHAIVARFRAAGVAAEHVDGDTPNREKILKRLADGSLLVVSSCGVLSEGTDIPAVKCVVSARPTASLALAIQQAGRCMRPWRDAVPLILDHSGNYTRQKHGFPHADQSWSLDETRKAAGEKAPTRACDGCGLVVAISATTCPGCGAFFHEVKPVLDERPEELKLAAFSEEEKRAELDRLREFAAKRGFREGWAEKVYRAKFGEAPGVEAMAA